MLTLLARLHNEIKTFMQEEIGREVVEYTVVFALVSIILFSTISSLSEQIDSITAALIAYF